jgi:shikimate dehydrogenase
MKEYLVIGNQIAHSLSPELHNYWIRENSINGIYNKKKLNENDLKEFFQKIRNKEINGANITVPFKRDVISYVDQLSLEAEKTQSVNTVYLKNDKIIGHNTDIDGFKLAIKDANYDVEGKKVLILGAGGVVPSIIFALYKMRVLSVTISNRTKTKAENLKSLFNDLKIIDWGEASSSDMIINATSIGLKKEDKLNLDFSKFQNCEFFYDVIYNPKETNFLRDGKSLGKKTENGKKMFIYQAAKSFKIWHGVEPKINEQVVGLLDK